MPTPKLQSQPIQHHKKSIGTPRIQSYQHTIPSKQKLIPVMQLQLLVQQLNHMYDTYEKKYLLMI